ncbi:hypothetical protein GF376_03365 [Candidatus Peregrinibacteria bacterium]|nr:hypothetical protein [Candidatus Peregrinibacteria bacterium]
MATREQLQKDLEKALKECVILPDKEKQYWLDQLDTLPEPVLQNVLDAINHKNRLINSFIEVELATDKKQNLLSSLKGYIKKIKINALKIEEGKQQEDDEQQLKKKLETINDE